MSDTVRDTSAVRSHVKAVEDLRGPAGKLEAVLNTGVPEALYAVVVAHPHPLGGGTMHNKVVYHAAKAFSRFGLPVLRFNFRGTGLSEGIHDEGHGEVEDVHAALDWLEREFQLPILFAGFSFGANVGLRACCGDARVHGLCGIGLPVKAEGREYSYSFLHRCGEVPKLFVIGDHDPYAPRAVLDAILAAAPEPKTTVWIAGADHFFAGVPGSPAPKLDALREAIRSWATTQFRLGDL
jgi:alpha/beta superfamily hydrolase